jgi:CBS domain-containing protein
MKVGSVCKRHVAVVRETETLLEAARRMRDDHVGSLVIVVETGGHPVPLGILTDRDLATRVLANGIDPSSRQVGDLDTARAVTASEDEDLSTALERMRRHEIRRMPVVDAKGRLYGVLSLDDIIDVLAVDVRRVAELIGAQRPGTLAPPAGFRSN